MVLCAEVGVPHGPDHLVQAIEDLPVPAAYQWACRYGSGFSQGQLSGNDPLGDLDMSLGATNIPAEGCWWVDAASILRTQIRIFWRPSRIVLT